MVYETSLRIIQSSIYKMGDQVKISSGSFEVMGFDGPSVIVKRNGELIAGAYLSADTIDGIRDLEFMGDYGHKTKRKVCDLIVEWVSKNAERVFPIGSKVRQS